MPPPKINPRDIRKVKIPKQGDYFVASPSGSDAPEIVSARAFLQRLGLSAGTDAAVAALAHTVAVNSTLATHGFGFFIGGTMLADELLGGVVFASDMYFTNDAAIIIKSQVRAEADATFKLVTGFPDTVVGTILFPANSTAGTLTWSPDLYTLTAGTQLRLRSPNPADVSLAYVSGTVDGQVQ